MSDFLFFLFLFFLASFLFLSLSMHGLVFGYKILKEIALCMAYGRVAGERMKPHLRCVEGFDYGHEFGMDCFFQ